MRQGTETSEMSERAKAFSVESLLNAGVPEKGKSERVGEIDSRVQTKSGITAELCCSGLWEKFNRLGTEMIVTKAGRRMFPTLKLRLHGLQFTATYIVYMDLALAAGTRYRYNFHRSEWIPAGPTTGSAPKCLYLHPASPARGEVWMSQDISFDKLKLTNHRKPVMHNQVSLRSMHKYQPRIHVLQVLADCTASPNILEYVRTHSERSLTFTFDQTAFITVTAYQNHRITRLKIESNPFAKGFRDTPRSKAAVTGGPTVDEKCQVNTSA